MARLLRVDCPGLWYHLTAHGNEQRTFFRDDRDREHFLELLGQWVERFGFRLHASSKFLDNCLAMRRSRGLSVFVLRHAADLISFVEVSSQVARREIACFDAWSRRVGA